MSADLTERIRGATSQGQAPNSEAIFGRARQLRRRRRAITGTLGLLVLVLVAVPVLARLEMADVVLDGRTTPVDWPLDVRYEIQRFSGDGGAPTTELHEFGGSGWDDWTAVAVRTEGVRGEVQRAKGGSHYRGVMAVEDTAGEPFASLDRARTIELDDREPVEEPTGRIAPDDLMNTRFGTYREPGRAEGEVERVLDDDLPDLRAQVAAELDLDPGALVAQRIEQGCEQSNPLACYELRYVALPAAQVPLYAEEINVETGLEARLRVTHLRIPDPADAPQPTAAVLDLPAVGEASAEWLEDGTPVFVARHDDGQVTVVQALSTHQLWGLDKMIGWCPSSRTFDDVQHGSQWNERGTYIGGPAPTGLVTYDATVRGDAVHVGQHRAPHPRSAGPGDREHVGPLCRWAADGNLDAPGYSDDPPVVFHTPDDAPLPRVAPEALHDNESAVVQGTAVFRPDQPIQICSTPSPGPQTACPPDTPTLANAASPEQTATLTGAFLIRPGADGLPHAAVFSGAEFNEMALPLEELDEDGVKPMVIRGQPVFVARRGEDVTVFLADPQHLDGEALWWCPQAKVFVSPAHGELFDADGRLWDGPATRGLDRYKVEIVDDLVMVLYRQVITGEPPRPGADAAGLLQGDALDGYRNPPWPSRSFCRDPVPSQW